MSGAPFLLVPLGKRHDRAAFRSDSELLNHYLREQATQDIRRRVAACYVALADESRIAGYYTLASASLVLADLPASTSKKFHRLARFAAVFPVFLLAAINRSRQSFLQVLEPFDLVLGL